MNEKPIRLIFRCILGSYVFILGLTAAAKLVSLFGHQQILNTIDFVVPVRIRHLLAFAAIGEMCVIGNILWNRQPFYRFLGVNVLSSVFLLYRFMLGIEPARHCPCLGTVGSQLGLDKRTSDSFLSISAAYMFLSSLLVLVWFLKKSEPLATVADGRPSSVVN